MPQQSDPYVEDVHDRLEGEDLNKWRKAMMSCIDTWKKVKRGKCPKQCLHMAITCLISISVQTSKTQVSEDQRKTSCRDVMYKFEHWPIPSQPFAIDAGV
jgi:hypothetical protein